MLQLENVTNPCWDVRRGLPLLTTQLLPPPHVNARQGVFASFCRIGGHFRIKVSILVWKADLSSRDSYNGPLLIGVGLRADLSPLSEVNVFLAT